MPSTLKYEKQTTRPGSDLRQLMIQYNNLAKTVAQLQQASVSDVFYGWYGIGTNSGAAPMKIGSTDTRVATSAMTFSIAGVPYIKALDAVGTAFGTILTIPANKWGLIAFDVIGAGTVTYPIAPLSATGYATEAAAIADMPNQTTLKARAGYITVLASSSVWIAGTDSPAGGGTGNPATTTNYYPAAGVMSPQGVALGPNGNVTAASHPAWTGGKNGVLTSPGLGIGSTDYYLANLLAFTYNANGLTNIPKAAVSTGAAIGALGTIPADKWGVIVSLINSLGTVTYMSGPDNYVDGYKTEAAAIGDLNKIFPAAGLALMGSTTVKTGAGLPWVAGTDAFATGTTGNEASATNYYNTPGVVLQTGMTASLIASREGTVINSAQY